MFRGGHKLHPGCDVLPTDFSKAFTNTGLDSLPHYSSLVMWWITASALRNLLTRVKLLTFHKVSAQGLSFAVWGLMLKIEKEIFPLYGCQYFINGLDIARVFSLCKWSKGISLLWGDCMVRMTEVVFFLLLHFGFVIALEGYRSVYRSDSRID